MSQNDYTFAIVKMIIDSNSKDVIGNGVLLVLAQPYRKSILDVFAVAPTLTDILQKEDFVLVDLIKKEIIRIIRNETRTRIDNLYKTIMDSPFQPQND